MQSRGIGIGSSPVGSEGFAHTAARPRRSKTKLVLLVYITIILLVTHIYNIL